MLHHLERSCKKYFTRPVNFLHGKYNDFASVSTVIILTKFVHNSPHLVSINSHILSRDINLALLMQLFVMNMWSKSYVGL